ncbi:MAG: peptidylprolyl isomerase, partial [Brevundimonas sp.]
TVAPAAAPGVPPPVPEGATRIVIHAKPGDIIADLYGDKAPVTVANFLRYVDQKRFDAMTFYRASHPDNVLDYGVIQGGLNGNAAKMLKPIAHEPTSKTGIIHLDGTLSMGRLAPGTATADFFICVGDSPYLDADPSQPGDNLGFAAFGRVVQGMDIVRQILVLPRSPTRGVGPMKGQLLEPPVPISTVRRV